MLRISELSARSWMAGGDRKYSGPRAEEARDSAPVRKPDRACLIAFAVFLYTLPMLWGADPGHCRQFEGGNSTVLTNRSESESRTVWSRAAEDQVLAATPGGPRSRSAIRRLNPEMVKQEKAKMQLEANSEPIRPAGTAKPALDKAPAPGEQVSYMELPPRIRDSIPLCVTMLVYSERSDKRSITINSCRTLEGQEVSPGLKVVEITSDGAVFSYQGYRFRKRVVGD